MQPIKSVTDSPAYNCSAFEVVKVNSPEMGLKNQVIFNEHDIDLLFGHSAEKKEKLVQIASFVYQAAKGTFLKTGAIGLSVEQAEQLYPNFFNYNLVLVQPFKGIYHQISYAVFEISSKSDEEILSIKRVQLAAKIALVNQILSQNQKLSIKIDNKIYPIELKQLESKEVLGFSISFGVCTLETKYDFTIKSSSKLRLGNPIPDEPIEKFHFYVEPIHGIEPAPQLVDHASFSHCITIALFGRRISTETSFNLTNDCNQSFKVSLQEVTIRPALLHTSRDAEKNFSSKFHYPPFYEPVSEKPCVLHGQMTEVIFTQGIAVEASSVELEIIGTSETYLDWEKRNMRAAWLSEKEIIDALAKARKQICLGSHLYIDLSSGLYEARVILINHDRSDFQKLIKPLYKITSNTTYQITLARNSKYFLVPTNTPHPIKKGVFILSQFRTPANQESEPKIEESELDQEIRKLTNNKYVEGQSMYLKLSKGVEVNLIVQELDLEGNVGLGQIHSGTELIFQKEAKVPCNFIQKNQLIEIKDPICKLEELGLGGLSCAMQTIIRNIFFSRGPYKAEMAKRGLKPEKGILFYGPPGTGKTKLALALSTMLGSLGDHAQKLSGPSLFDKWAGESEKNVRKLFEPAKIAQKELGDKSPLYVIIIDEIDALLASRQNDGSRWRDSVVAQFLAEMDGLVELNNILIIGMTNRLDHMDGAIKRAGRFGIQIEIGLPDEKARAKIFEIHTKQLKNIDRLSPDIDFPSLVHRTSKQSGAAIEALVKKANGYCMERIIKNQIPPEAIEHYAERFVCMSDFELAFAELNKELSDAPPPSMFL
jgi:hypothetical protein